MTIVSLSVTAFKDQTILYHRFPHPCTDLGKSGTKDLQVILVKICKVHENGRFNAPNFIIYFRI